MRCAQPRRPDPPPPPHTHTPATDQRRTRCNEVRESETETETNLGDRKGADGGNGIISRSSRVADLRPGVVRIHVVLHEDRDLLLHRRVHRRRVQHLLSEVRELSCITIRHGRNGFVRLRVMHDADPAGLPLVKPALRGLRVLHLVQVDLVRVERVSEHRRGEIGASAPQRR
jgi:hypothetical protein